MKPEIKKGMFANGISSTPGVINLIESTRTNSNLVSPSYKDLADWKILEYLHPNQRREDLRWNHQKGIGEINGDAILPNLNLKSDLGLMINFLNRVIRIRLVGLVRYRPVMDLPNLRGNPSRVDLSLDDNLFRDRFGRLVKIWLGTYIDIHHCSHLNQDVTLKRKDLKSQLTRLINLEATRSHMIQHLTALPLMYSTRITIITFKNLHPKIIVIST